MLLNEEWRARRVTRRGFIQEGNRPLVAVSFNELHRKRKEYHKIRYEKIPFPINKQIPRKDL